MESLSPAPYNAEDSAPFIDESHSHTLETRVMTIELHLASDRKERRISLKKDLALSSDD